MKKQPYFSIIYEDEHIVGVDKAAGIAVSADRWDGSKERLDRLLNALYAENLSAVSEPASQQVCIVHRIDRDTSGLVVFAKDGETHTMLSRAFENRTVKKQYLAVIQGRPSWTQTVCDLPLVPDGDKQHRTIIDKYRGKKSVTWFQFLGAAGNYGVVAVCPETGRTHQIRVHLASLGHPVVCDPLYGSTKPVFLSSFKQAWRGDPLEERPLLARLGLHAASLALPDYGETGHTLVLRAPLAHDMAALINQIQKRSGPLSLDLFGN